MNTAVINLKIDQVTKREAQSVAEELGISLSSLIKGFLKHLVRTRTIEFSASEEPTKYLISALQESAEDIKARRVSPVFTNTKDAVNWLRSPKKKYAGKLFQKVR
jgi:addiction module RelB/DinJ family antitoxin